MKDSFEKLHSNQKIFINEMLKRGISVEIIDVEDEIIKTSFNGHDEIFLDRNSSIMPYNVSVLVGKKDFTKKMLLKNGISVPKGESFLASDTNGILNFFNSLNCPAVIKPVFGSHGFDVYTDLKTEAEVLFALNKLILHRGESTKIVIEEYFKASEYRVFVTKNGDYAVLYRDPAHVFGNGKNSIDELIKLENYKRMHPRTNALCEILVDGEVISFLSKQNLSLQSIPKKGEKIYLRSNSNVATGGVCEDYTDKVHKSVIDIALKCLKTFPGLPYAGVDYMTNSISEKQNKNSYRILEVNTVPGIHMHYKPAIGKSQNISKYIVDLIYPETK